MYLKMTAGKIYYEFGNINSSQQNISPLFVIPGGPGLCHRIYQFHSKGLEEFVQVIYHDPRGCGKSSGFSLEKYQIEDNVDDIHRLKNHLGFKKISLLGTSYGGIVAQRYAIKYPKECDKLILVATTPSFRFIEQAKANLASRGTMAQKLIAQHLWEGSFKNDAHAGEFSKKMRTLYSVKASQSKTAVRTGKIFAHKVLNLGFKTFLRTFDHIPHLHNIKCQTLILAGKKDWITPPEQSRVLFEHIPNSTLKLFNQCGHSVAMDRQKDYIKFIKNFIRNSV